MGINMKRKKYWISPLPETCDICHGPFDRVSNYFYDFKTIMGPWALGCQTCFEKYSVGGKLGTGLGQKYLIKTKELVAG
jgi:hypothetical protein